MDSLSLSLIKERRGGYTSGAEQSERALGEHCAPLALIAGGRGEVSTAKCARINNIVIHIADSHCSSDSHIVNDHGVHRGQHSVRLYGHGAA